MVHSDIGIVMNTVRSSAYFIAFLDDVSNIMNIFQYIGPHAVLWGMPMLLTLSLAVILDGLWETRHLQFVMQSTHRAIVYSLCLCDSIGDFLELSPH